MHVYKINICLSFFCYTYLIFPRVTSDFGKNKNIKNKMMKTNYRLYIYIFKIHVLEIKEITHQQMALITETRLLDVMAYAIATGKTALFHNVNTHVNNSLKSSN